MQITSKQDALDKIESLKNIAKLRPQVADGLEGLLQLKFDPVGCNPLTATHLNWIEQINQTATYLVSFLGAIWLYDMKILPSDAPLSLNLGTESGYDIESIDHDIYCEVFAAVSGANNGKLKKDIDRLQSENRGAKQKFVFCMTAADSQALPDVQSHRDVEVTIVRFSRIANFAEIPSRP